MGAPAKEKGEEEKEIKSGKRSLDAEETEEVETKKSKSAEFSVDSNGFTEAYIDGKCQFMGKNGQKAGLGVWWGEGHTLNTSKAVTGEKLSKNASGVQAATEAVRLAGKEGIKKLMIHTDSQFLINCSGWIAGWKKKELMAMDKELTDNEGLEVKWSLTKGKEGNKG